MIEKKRTVQRLIVEVRHVNLGIGEETRERKLRKKLRTLTYHAAQMLQQMKNPTADYAIVLHNLRSEVEHMQRWDSTTPEGMA